MTPAHPLVRWLPVSDTPSGWWFTFGLQVVVTVAALAFWGVWFFGDRSLVALTDAADYVGFQNTFVVADGWMIWGCVAGAWAQLRRRPSAFLWMIQSSSAAIFLGAMDVSWDLQHGLYFTGSPSVPVELAINAASFFCGGWGLTFAWRHRHRLLASASAL